MRVTIAAFAYLTSVVIGGAAMFVRWKLIALASVLRIATHVIPSGAQFSMQPLFDVQPHAHWLGLALVSLSGAIVFFALIAQRREESK